MLHPNPVRRGARVASVCALATLALPASALATPTWLSPATLGGTAGSSNPDVVVDAAGNVTSVWAEHPHIYAATRAAGHEWAPPVAITPSVTSSSHDPAIASDAEGNLIAIWERYSGSRYVIEVATKPAGQTAWSSPAVVSATEIGSGEQPVIAASPGGRVVAAWSEYDSASSTWQIRARTGTTTTGLTSGARTVSSDTTGRASDPSVDVAEDGALIVAWSFTPSSGSTNKVNTVVREAGADWPASVTTLESGMYAGRAAAAIEGGTPRVVWQGPADPTTYKVKGRVARMSAGSWTKADLTSAMSSVAFFSLDTNAVGEAVAGWRACPSACEFHAALAAPGGDFGPAHTFGPGGAGSVRISESGTATATWPVSGSVPKVFASQLRDGAWDAPAEVSDGMHTSESPAVGVDPDGNAAVAFTTDLPKDAFSTVYKTQTRLLDGAGPRRHAVEVPETANAGTPVYFAVDAFDPFAPSVAVAWGFSDGGSAEGRSVSHAFAQAGAHVVVVKAQDAFGNASTATRTITVTGSTSGGGVTDAAPAAPAAPSDSPVVVPGATPTLESPAPVSGAVLDTALRVASAAATKALAKATIAEVTRGNVAYRVKAPGPGQYVGELRALVVNGKVVSAARRKPVVLARAKRTFTAAGTATVRLKPTKAGRRLLVRARKVKRKLRLTLSTGFTPKGGKAVVTKRRIRMR